MFMVSGKSFCKNLGFLRISFVREKCEIFRYFCEISLESASRKNAKISHKKTNAKIFVEKQNGTKNTEEKLLIMICSSNVELSEQILSN